MNAIVIIPVYQPESCLERIVDELWDAGNQIIIVNDGSSQDTLDTFLKLGEKAIVLHHNQNLGKGAAIKTALKYIEDDLWEYDVVGVMDGDGQHLVHDMEKLIFKAREYRGSLILGVRKFDENTPLRSKFGNAMTKKVFQLTTGKKVSDTQSGLRAFTRNRIKNFGNISGERYEYETRVLMTCAKEQIPIEEVEIETIYHDKENSCSHFHVIRDSWRIYKEILKFSFVSISSFVLDYLLFCFLFFISGKDAGMIVIFNILARLCSGTYNYLMNTRVVFIEKVTAKSAGKYLVLALGILFLNNIFLKQYTVIFQNVELAKIVTEISLFLISFTVQKFIIYSKHKNQWLNHLKEHYKHEKNYQKGAL